MDKTVKIYLMLSIIILVGMIALEKSKPKMVDWNPSYVSYHKKPFGTYVLFKELKSLFPRTKIEKINKSPYEYLNNGRRIGTYIFINDALHFEKEELNELLAFVERGNDVFISTHSIDIDSLNIKTKQLYDIKALESPFHKLLNKNLSNNMFDLDRQSVNYVFSEIDTTTTVALGVTGYMEDQLDESSNEINFIKQSYGKGFLYLHTFPEAFSNYFILKDSNHQYTASLLSYVDSSKPILWDAYYKTGKDLYTSPMHHIFSSKSLKWAYYIGLIGVLIFILVEGKRKQRYIAIITPLKNQTVDFANTISNMYFEKSEHKTIATHKINYLLEYIRSKLHIQTSILDADFYENVASRSGNTKELIDSLFGHINETQAKDRVTDKELITLNTLIEEFKNQK